MLSDSCMVSAQQDGLVGDGPCRVEGEKAAPGSCPLVSHDACVPVSSRTRCHHNKGKKKIQKVDNSIDSFRIRTAFVKFDRWDQETILRANFMEYCVSDSRN